MALRKAISYAEQAPQHLKLLKNGRMAQKIVLNAVSSYVITFFHNKPQVQTKVEPE
jgi:hypothetical protein